MEFGNEEDEGETEFGNEGKNGAWKGGASMS